MPAATFPPSADQLPTPSVAPGTYPPQGLARLLGHGTSVSATSGKLPALPPGFLLVTMPPESAPVVAEVYWRPGCPYCAALRRDLSRRGVPSRWHDIWQDEDARQFVRAANRGCETVPTVQVGVTTLTNPRGAQVAALIGSTGDGDARERLAPLPPSAGRMLSWLPTIALVAGGFVAEFAGYAGASWVFDALAIAAWWLTRRLRR